MAKEEIIVGIDLGTTNSEAAAFVDSRVNVLGPEGDKILPSCVGLSPVGELLIGRPARNQYRLYPERTIRSIKRKMGQDEKLTLGENKLTPPEVSALILRELARRASENLRTKVSKAVITVPAYFSDAQRQATREAGALADLEVVRILNEPTAAALAYGADGRARTELIYDLGGGTFDVSVVTMEQDVTEVLASHGNNHLGGDDFDALLFDYLAEAFEKKHGVDLRHDHPQAAARLWWAAEAAKQKLSYEPFVRIREEGLVSDSAPLHLDLEISRDRYEAMIRSLAESTLESVSKALADAGKTARDLDGIILVGGATRTPLIARMLEKRTELIPRQEVDPDLCVALGAGVMASRLAGHEVQRILVDVSPYSFGISHLGERGGVPYPHCYRPTIRRNTPLPVTRTETYYTSMPYQERVEINVYQGDDSDALKNILIGDFQINDLEGFEDMNEVLCRMSLDLDGILHVSAIQKRTGKSGHITIENASRPKTEQEIEAARARLRQLYDDWDMRPDEASEADWIEDESVANDNTEAAKVVEIADPALREDVRNARLLLDRSRSRLDAIHDEDKEEAIELHEAIEAAIVAGDGDSIEKFSEKLREILFFVEGK